MARIFYYNEPAPLVSNLSHSHVLTTKEMNCIRCCGDTRDGKIVRKSSETDRILKFAVGGVTELLRLFSTGNKRTNNEEESKGVSVSSVDDILMILKVDYEKSYFVTGNFTSEIYADDCLFEDPTIKFRGKELYYRNLKLLVPFLDCPSICLQNIDKVFTSKTASVLAKWKLRTYLKLPWRPLISIDGSTVYEINEEFEVSQINLIYFHDFPIQTNPGDFDDNFFVCYKIIRHSESWDVSALEAIGQIFNINSGS